MSDFTAGVRRALNAVGRVARTVPTFDVDKERINVFELDECYVFKHYFELDEAFNAVREFYNGEEYRFEVPKDDLAAVQERLADHYFEVAEVEDPERFCVVKRKHTDHPKLLFKNAVEVRSCGGYTVFIMKDQLSVEQGVNYGAIPFEETDRNVTL